MDATNRSYRRKASSHLIYIIILHAPFDKCGQPITGKQGGKQEAVSGRQILQLVAREKTGLNRQPCHDRAVREMSQATVN